MEEETTRKSRICIVKSLAKSTTEDSLRAHFKDIADIQEIEMKKRDDGTCGGIAFISFSSPELAEKAAREKHESILENRFIEVVVKQNRSGPRPPKPSDIPAPETKKPERERHHHRHHHHHHRRHHSYSDSSSDSKHRSSSHRSKKSNISKKDKKSSDSSSA